MLGIKIKYSDNNDEGNVRHAVVSTEKRTDQWSVLLVSVGENRDRKAFAQLFAHFAPLLKSFAEASRHEGWFPGLSEDLVQEVMIKVWQKAAGYKPEKASATTWIYTVARNCRIDMLRRKSNTQHLPLENEDFWHEPNNRSAVASTAGCCRTVRFHPRRQCGHHHHQKPVQRHCDLLLWRLSPLQLAPRDGGPGVLAHIRQKVDHDWFGFL